MNETIEQKGSKPPGLIPKQVQNYVILGVATVLIAIIWLTSGNSKKPANQGSTSGNPHRTLPASTRRSLKSTKPS